MYNEAMLYQAQGRYEDAIRVLSDAVTGIKGQSPVLPSRRRSLAILYQQLGQLYRDPRIIKRRFYLRRIGAFGRGRGSPRAHEVIMDTYRAAKDLPKALQTGNGSTGEIPADPSIRTSQALLLGEMGKRTTRSRC